MESTTFIPTDLIWLFLCTVICRRSMENGQWVLFFIWITHVYLYSLIWYIYYWTWLFLNNVTNRGTVFPVRTTWVHPRFIVFWPFHCLSSSMFGFWLSLWSHFLYKLRLISLSHRQHYAILAILFRPFGFPEHNYINK